MIDCYNHLKRKLLTNPPRVENKVVRSLRRKCISSCRQPLGQLTGTYHSHELVFKEAFKPSMTFQSSEVQVGGTITLNLLFGV